jgi:natural resistance-associated macrophage protein
MQFEFQQMDNLNQFINVLQSVQLPFALLPLLHFASDPQVMSLWAVSGFQRLIGWVLAIGLIGVNVFLVKQRYDVLTDHFAQLVCVCVAACYVLILIYIVREDIRQFLRFLTGRTSPPFTPIMSTAASGPSYYRKLS